MRNDDRERNPTDHKGVASESGKDIASMCLVCNYRFFPLAQAPILLMSDVVERQYRKVVTEVRSF
jgi:hypothetical protein